MKGLALHGGLRSCAPPAHTGSGGTALLLRPPRLFYAQLRKIRIRVLKKLDLEIAVPELT